VHRSGFCCYAWRGRTERRTYLDTMAMDASVFGSVSWTYCCPDL